MDWQPVKTAAAVKIRNCLRFMHEPASSGEIIFSIFKNQAGYKSPIDVLASAIIDRENVPNTEPRLDPADGLEVDAHRRVSHETVESPVLFVQRRFPNQFEHGDQLQHVGDGQLFMRDRVPKIETVFETLRTSVLAGAVQRGIAHDGLQRELLDFQIVEQLGHNFGIFAKRRLGGNSDFDSHTEGGVDELVFRDVLVEGAARAQVDIVE